MNGHNLQSPVYCRYYIPDGGQLVQKPFRNMKNRTSQIIHKEQLNSFIITFF